jgi:hypothetical protein
LNKGNLTVQNHDDGWVTLIDQHPTAIMVLNGKIFLYSIGADMAVEEFSSDHVECGTP